MNCKWVKFTEKQPEPNVPIIWSYLIECRLYDENRCVIGHGNKSIIDVKSFDNWEIEYVKSVHSEAVWLDGLDSPSF